jgi:recombination protein RecA
MVKRVEDSKKQKSVDTAISQIEKQFGKGSIMRLAGDAGTVPVEVIPTGALALDVALGAGGLPKGRIVEIYGNEGSGKTTLTLHVIAEAIKRGGVAAFVDAEHALNPELASRIGVDLENLLISQPDNGEEALEITDTLVRSGAFDVIVVDSVAALVPRAELEGEMGDSHMGLQARLMSQALRKLTGSISKSNTCVIFVNQIRMKIGVMFGNPETTSGGNALKFYSSVRMEIRRIGAIKDGQNVTGNRVKVRVVKNKVAAPFKEAEMDLMFGEGFSREGGILDLAEVQGIVQKSGTWFSHGETRLGQGRENVKRYFKENPVVARQIEDEIRMALGLPTLTESGLAEEPVADVAVARMNGTDEAKAVKSTKKADVPEETDLAKEVIEETEEAAV